MSWFRRRCDGRNHRWSRWKWHNRYVDRVAIKSRSCRCGSIQQFVPSTGVVTIWSPGGLDSGLLDRGVTRMLYEELDQ